MHALRDTWGLIFKYDILILPVGSLHEEALELMLLMIVFNLSANIFYSSVVYGEDVVSFSRCPRKVGRSFNMIVYIIILQ